MQIPNPRFTKSGIVKVGQESGQEINLKNPVGHVHNIILDQETKKLQIEVFAQDEEGINQVSRWYEVVLDEPAWNDYMMTFFANHVRRLMRDNFEEFQNLSPAQ